MSEQEFNTQPESNLAGGNEQVDTLNDPTESLRRGLIKLYHNHLDQIDTQLERRLIDRRKADRLASRVLDFAAKDGLEDEVKYTSVEQAREIMKYGFFFGREEVKKAFQIEITERIPIIPFSPEELEKARTLGQFLVLRVNQTTNGQPLTSEKMVELVQPDFDRLNRKVIFNSWFIEQEFFTTETPNFEWALTTHNIIPGSIKKDYLEQTEMLADYLKNEVFAGSRMPKSYVNALAEFEASKDEIRNLIRQMEKQDATLKLSQLQINQMTRPSVVKVLYDMHVYSQNTFNRLPFIYTWTNSLEDDGSLVHIGNPVFGDAVIYADLYDYLDDQLGTLFTRTK